MPIKLAKIEFDLNYFILYRDSFQEPLTCKREKKIGKVTHFFSFFFEMDHEIEFE